MTDIEWLPMSSAPDDSRDVFLLWMGVLYIGHWTNTGWMTSDMTIDPDGWCPLPPKMRSITPVSGTLQHEKALGTVLDAVSGQGSPPDDDLTNDMVIGLLKFAFVVLILSGYGAIIWEVLRLISR